MGSLSHFKRKGAEMAQKEEFDRIVEAVPELAGLGASAPDGFKVLRGVDGSTVRVPRLSFIEHTNAIADVLKDPAADLQGVMAPVAGLPPLARRVIFATAYEHFKAWLLDECPVQALPFAIVHVPLFVGLYRELTMGAPEYAHEFTTEGADDE